VDCPLPPGCRTDTLDRILDLPGVQNMLLAARALGLGSTLTTLHLRFEKETEEALGLPPDVHSYALLPIGYPMGRFGPVRRAPLADFVYENRWGEPYRDL
jgi:nitroreductase